MGALTVKGKPKVIDHVDAVACKAYGALTEGVHVAGYTLERAMGQLEWLLEADRWQQLGTAFGDVNGFLDSVRLDGFRIVAEQRKRIAERIKELQPDASNRQIARTIGVDPETVRRDLGAANAARPNSNSSESAIQIETNAANAALGSEAASTSRNHRAEGTGDNEWFTPWQYLAAAREVMGEIDLDPASHLVAQQTVRALNYYTATENGLVQDWYGRVWLNPPYAQPLISQFAEKMVAEVRDGRVSQAIMLTHNYTDTAWFHHAEAAADLICFTRGRIRFVDADGDDCAPTQGQAFFYYGAETERFREVFSRLGFVR